MTCWRECGAGWSDLPSLCRRWRTLPCEPEERFEKVSVRQGVWKSRDCRKQFTVTVGTVFQGSKIPLNKWVTAIDLMGDAVKILNVNQLHSRLRLTCRSARFFVRRLGEGIRHEVLGKRLTVKGGVGQAFWSD